MNKRDAINHIRQFGGRLDRFRKSVGGSGDGGRNAPKRAKSSPKPVNRKTNVFNEQVRYAFHGALQDLKSKPFATFLTVMVIAISLTLPSVCYMVYKNVNQAATQYYPSPQITVYLQKTLDDDAAAGVVAQLQAEQGVEKVNYLSREDALGEFRNWSGFGGALDMDIRLTFVTGDRSALAVVIDDNRIVTIVFGNIVITDLIGIRTSQDQ